MITFFKNKVDLLHNDDPVPFAIADDNHDPPGSQI